MRKQYVHLSAYVCEMCAGLVIAGAVAVRENEISKETDIRQLGAICLSCGHRQSGPTEPGRARHLLPIEWDHIIPSGAGRPVVASAEALSQVRTDAKSA